MKGRAVSGSANAAGSRRARGRGAAAIALGALALLAGAARGAPERPALAGRPVRAFVAIEPDTATVGDRLHLSLRVERPPDVEVSVPDVASAIAPLEVLESGLLPPVERDGLVIEERDFTVAAFETGVLGVPSLRVRYVDAEGDTGFVRTDSTYVAIVSVLPEDEEEVAPRDIKPPVDLPRTIWPILLAAAAAVGLLLAYRYARAWWQKRGRPAPKEDVEPAVPPRAAHLVAFERLEALRREDPAGRGNIEGFYVAVTDIVRRYLRDRFAVDAIDMTTSELDPALRRARIEPAEVERMIAYLMHADLAKFAKLHPDAARAGADFEEAWGFVERTRFRGEEPGPEAGPGSDDGGDGAEAGPRAGEPGGAGTGDESVGVQAEGQEGVR
jgi:hypothetical protein